MARRPLAAARSAPLRERPTPEPEQPPAQLPASLQGTEVDGWLGVDENGHLVVTPGLRWFFDYFLSASGEESPARLRSRLVTEIEKRLPPSGAGEAVALLDRYLSYREQVRALAQAGAAEELEQRLDELHRIRVDTFGEADATALFGEEETVQRLDVQRRRVLADTTLAPAERERQLAELEQQLPEPISSGRREALAVLALGREEQQLREAGASADEVRALREQHFGRDAAERLDALDREEAEWRRRLDDYRTEKHRLDTDATLTAAAREQALAALRAEHFSAEEQLRVEALDRMEAVSP